MNRSLLLAAIVVAAPAAAFAAAPSQPAVPAVKAAPAAVPAKSASAAKAEPALAPPAEQETYAYLKAPLFSEQFASFPVAMVGDETITGQELLDSLSAAHGTHGAKVSAGRTDYSVLLDRLINVRLLVTEAREIGIDDLPEVKQDFAAVDRETGLRLLQEQAVADAKAEPAEVERLFKAMVREWKVSSALIFAEQEARKLVAEVKAGGDFDALAKALVAAKKGEASGVAEFLPRAKLQPQVLEALEATKVGQLAEPTRLKGGWAVMKVLEVRYPEDPKARAEAEALALSQQRQRALQKYYVEIIKRYATVDQPLLKSLDFEAKKPGMEAMKKDKRVIATIKGAKAVTVGDLTEELSSGFYHGADNAVASKKANREKNSRFDGLLSSRIVPLEVKRTAIPDSAAFKRAVADRQRNILFNKFLERAIVPELKYSEQQVQDYYDAHQKDFMVPGFYKLEALAFTDAKGAQAAGSKLKAGTDFKWLAANADGQLPADKATIHLDGGVYIASALPAPLVNALGGASKGDFRLYTDEAGASYTVHVLDIVPPAPKPLAEARQEIGNILFNDALVKSIETWAGKLRQARGVKIFITKIGD